jgi:radical SAM superfamily enzyme YgiQ (UPF0313 family)
MIGLPHETQQDVEELFAINREFQPSFVKVMTFYPFKNTPIYDLCVKEDLIDQDRLDQINNYDGVSGLKFSPEYHEYLKKVREEFNMMLTNYHHASQGHYIKFTNSVAKFIPYE